MINVQKRNWEQSLPFFSSLIFSLLLSTFNCQRQTTQVALEQFSTVYPVESKTIDSLPKGKILLRYDMDAWKSMGVNQQLFTFYDEKGSVVKEFISSRPPERSPYGKLKISYFADSPKSVSPSLIDTLSTNGYFNLINLTYSDKKRVFKNAKIDLPDSIIRNSEKIYHSPPSVEYFNGHYLLTNSIFGITDKSKKSIWKSEYLTVYDYKFNIAQEIEITQEFFSTKCLSDDGRYLLLVQVLTHQNSDTEVDTSDQWAEDTANEDYDLPLKLIDLKSNTQTLIDVDFRGQPVTDIKYIKGAFHAIFGSDTHVMVDIKNRKAYSKYYNERMNEPLLQRIEQGFLDISQYRAYSF